MRELRVEDALMYLDQVKMEFGDRPHIYNEFLDIMKNFKSQQIDTPGVIERVSNLFHGNKKLVLGFNTFLPEGYKIELPIDGAPAVYHAPGQVGVTQIMGPHGGAAQSRAGSAAVAAAAPPPPPRPAIGQRISAPHPVPAAMTKVTPQPMHAHSQPLGTTPAAAGQPRFGPQGVQPNSSSASVPSPDSQAVSARQRLAAAEKHGRQLAEQSQLQQQAARNSQMPMQPTSQPPRAHMPPVVNHMPPAAHGGPSNQGAVQPPGPGQPVEFDYAINYVTTIKKRFANQPDTYKNFLKILHTYQKEQRGIKEVLNEVSELFADHPDLLQEFTYFLPDAVQATAKAQLASVVKIAEERKKKNLQETAAHVAHVAEARTQAILKAKIAAREHKQMRSGQPDHLGSDSAGVIAMGMAAPGPAAFPQAPQPASIPFGATQGRSDEREREICRAAVYGQVSFAPVRPPKKGELTAAQSAAKYGRPRSIPEPPMQSNSKEETFFERAKAHLNRKELAPDKPAGSRRHTPYTEFLKCLHLFGAGILNREEIVLLLKSLFEQGHAPKTGANAGGGKTNPKIAKAAQELLADFEALLLGRGPYAAQQGIMKDRSKYGALSVRMCDFSRSENPTTSYWTYPSDHPQKRYSHSGQSKEDASVLNNAVVCVGCNTARPSIEGYDGPQVRRNVYEEIMFKIEDERFEIDMAIERNYSAMRLVEPLAEEIIALKEREEREGQPIGRMHYILRPNALGPNHIGAIARLYGESGDEVAHHLSRNPVAVLPIVYKRMKEKNTEWREVRKEGNKQWKVATADNLEGSLDVQCYAKKRDLDRRLSLHNLGEECRRPRHFQKLSRKQEISKGLQNILPTFQIESSEPEYVLFQPHLVLNVGNGMSHKDAHDLLWKQVLKITKSSSDRYKVSRLWAEFLVPFFNLPLHWFLGELRDWVQGARSSFAAEYEVGQHIRTAYGDGIVKDVKPSHSHDGFNYTVALPYGVAYLRPSSIFHSVALPPKSKEKNFVRLNGKFELIEDVLDVQDPVCVKSGCLALFGTEKMYLFLRLYCALVGILAEANACLPVCTADAPLSPNEDSETVPGRGVKDSSAVPDGPEQKYRGYATLISALDNVLKGRMNSKAFETACRFLSKEHVFKLALLPRILEKCADELLRVVEEGAYSSLLDYARIPQMDIALLRTLSLRAADGAMYRIQYDPLAQSLMCCYLPKDAAMAVMPNDQASAAADSTDADGDDEAEDKNMAVDEELNEEDNEKDNMEEYAEEGQIDEEDDVDAPSSKRARVK